MQKTTLNIGLNIGDGTRTVSPTAVRAALALTGAVILASAVLQSTTEPTFVADIDKPLTEAQATLIAFALQQEAIAQVVDGQGELYGPGADAWRPFNRDYFLTLEQVQAKAA